MRTSFCCTSCFDVWRPHQQKKRRASGEEKHAETKNQKEDPVEVTGVPNSVEAVYGTRGFSEAFRRIRFYPVLLADFGRCSWKWAQDRRLQERTQAPRIGRPPPARRGSCTETPAASVIIEERFKIVLQHCNTSSSEGCASSCKLENTGFHLNPPRDEFDSRN